MIVEKTLYAIKCDVCNEKADDWYDHTEVWLDKDHAIENIYMCNWHIENDKHFCPNCHYFDDEGNLIIKS